MFQKSQKMEMMNYPVTSGLGVCNVTLLTVAMPRPQTQNVKQKIEREGFSSRTELKKTMPGDEIHYKAQQGLCDNPLRPTDFFFLVCLFLGEKEETASLIFPPHCDSSLSSVPSAAMPENSA